MKRAARTSLAAVALVATAAGLAACGASSPLDDASDAQVAYYDAYTDSSAPEAFGGTYEQAIDLGEAVCSDLGDGMGVAQLLDPADPDLEATKAVVVAAVTNLCPEYAGQVELLKEG